LCHVPDPLEFLSFLGSLANEAIFFFGQIIDADDLLVSYLKPHPALSPRGLELQFPFRFNDVTRISRGMIYHAFEEMGFGDIVEIPWRDEWLSPYFGHDQSEPRLEGETRDEVQSAWRVCAELSTGSKHAAMMAPIYIGSLVTSARYTATAMTPFVISPCSG